MMTTFHRSCRLCKCPAEHVDNQSCIRSGFPVLNALATYSIAFDVQSVGLEVWDMGLSRHHPPAGSCEWTAALRSGVVTRFQRLGLFRLRVCPEASCQGNGSFPQQPGVQRAGAGWPVHAQLAQIFQVGFLLPESSTA